MTVGDEHDGRCASPGMSSRRLNRFLLVYASQTGQAQAIAEKIHELASTRALSADLHCVSAADKKFHIAKERCVVIVSSTTGDGDTPDTARRFVRAIRKKTLSSDYLSSTHFTVLGLGDSNYNNFCNGGKSINKRLLELGARHFYPPGWADDATSLELVVEPWIEDLWPALYQSLGLPYDGEPAVSSPQQDVVLTTPGGTDVGVSARGSEVTHAVSSPQQDVLLTPGVSDVGVSARGSEVTHAVSSPQQDVLLTPGVADVGVSARGSEVTHAVSSPQQDVLLTTPGVADVGVSARGSEVTHAVSSPQQDVLLTTPGGTDRRVSARGSEITHASDDAPRSGSGPDPRSVVVETLSGVVASAVAMATSTMLHAGSPRRTATDNYHTASESSVERSPAGSDVPKAGSDVPANEKSETSDSTSACVDTSTDGRSESVDAESPIGTKPEDAGEASSPNSTGVHEEGSHPVWHAWAAELVKPNPQLANAKLKIPALPVSWLDVQFDSREDQDRGTDLSNGGGIETARIVGGKQLSRHDAVKTAYEVTLDISDLNWEYEPGDAFQMSCPNPEKEVNALIQRLGLEGIADASFTLAIRAGVRKPRAVVPAHLTHRTLTGALLHDLDVRALPSKALLRVMAEYCSDEADTIRLQELCSREGKDDYMQVFLSGKHPRPTLLDLLQAFPSCNLPLERILEQLPRLAARFYSVTSSPLKDPSRVRFVYNVSEYEGFDGIGRRGVCTGWITGQLLRAAGSRDTTDVTRRLASLTLNDSVTVPVMLRQSQHFRLPRDPCVPIIMIGPGTGVAPFIGFLQHLDALRTSKPDRATPDSWLFYGCRHSDRDHLYREEMERFLDRGTLTNLSVSFSRDPPEGATRHAKYVQDNIRASARELVRWIVERRAAVYVCGDATNMAAGVMAALTEAYAESCEVAEDEARAYVRRMQDEGRYLQDVWT